MAQMRGGEHRLSADGMSSAAVQYKLSLLNCCGLSVQQNYKVRKSLYSIKRKCLLEKIFLHS